MHLPTGVSSPSFSLTTISDWPSMRNLGGLLATTTSRIVRSNQNPVMHLYWTGFNRTLGGWAVTLACIVVSHLSHLALLLVGGETIFLLHTVSPWEDACRTYRWKCHLTDSVWTLDVTSRVPVKRTSVKFHNWLLFKYMKGDQFSLLLEMCENYRLVDVFTLKVNDV